MGRDGRGVKAASASSIEIGFTYQGQWCRERLKLKPTPANLKRAERHRAAIVHAIEQGTFDYATTFPQSKRLTQFQDQEIPTFQRAAEAWLDEVVRPIKHASTYEVYKRRVNNQFIPAFGDLRLDALTQQDISRWLTKQDVLRGVALGYLGNFRSIYAHARKRWQFDYDPLEGYRLDQGFRRSDRGRINPLNSEERDAVLAACKNSRERDLFTFWLWTGLRPSELCALNVDDIDLAQQRVIVQRGYTTATSRTEQDSESTKTRAGRRLVKLLPRADHAVRQQLERTDTILWPTPRKKHRHTPARLAVVWNNLLRRAEVTPRNVYQIRHTYVSMLLLAGESPMWVATQVGHTDWSFTLRTYSRFIPDDMPDAGSKAAEKWQ